MKWVEFSNTPPKFEVCNTLDGKCIIRFYCDVQKVSRNDGESGLLSTTYKAICYEMATNKSANLNSRIKNRYVDWLQKAKEQDGGIDAIKKHLIKESKTTLADFIVSHPQASSAHGNKLGIYSVTEAKQSLMIGRYTAYHAEKPTNPSAVLTWNESGKSSEVWTEDEFVQLMVEIKQYVYPLVSQQQTIEETINAATTLDELNTIIIDYCVVK